MSSTVQRYNTLNGVNIFRQGVGIRLELTFSQGTIFLARSCNLLVGALMFSSTNITPIIRFIDAYPAFLANYFFMFSGKPGDQRKNLIVFSNIPTLFLIVM